MPQLIVEGEGSFEVQSNQRLVNALRETVGIDQLHACGGFARCTTCRVEFISSPPPAMREAERAILTERGLIDTPGLRLSCQIMCEEDMHIRAVSRLRDNPKRKDTGTIPQAEMTP